MHKAEFDNSQSFNTYMKFLILIPFLLVLPFSDSFALEDPTYTVTDSSISLNWYPVPNIDYYAYTIGLYGTEITSGQTTGTILTISSLQPNTPYTVQIVEHFPNGIFGSTSTQQILTAPESFPPFTHPTGWYPYPKNNANVSMPINAPLDIGHEANWFFPENNGNAICFSFYGTGGKTIDSIQGNWGLMSLGNTKKQWSHVITSIWILPVQFQSNFNGGVSSSIPCHTSDNIKFTTLNQFTSIGGYRIAGAIAKLVSINSTNIEFNFRNINQLIPENSYIVIIHGAQSECEPNCVQAGRLNSELQALIYFR